MRLGKRVQAWLPIPRLSPSPQWLILRCFTSSFAARFPLWYWPVLRLLGLRFARIGIGSRELRWVCSSSNLNFWLPFLWCCCWGGRGLHSPLSSARRALSLL